MAPKKKPKRKKSVKSPSYVYNIVDVDFSQSTQAINDICNQHGSQGWQLISLGMTVQGTSNLVRLWFIRQGSIA